MCERSDRAGHSGHCLGAAQDSFPLGDQVLRPDRFPARSQSVYVSEVSACQNTFTHAVLTIR